MKLFKHSQGFLFSFGFDMLERKEKPNRIQWNDPTTGEWEAKATNMAGFIDPSFACHPEFLFELSSGDILAYQPGMCLTLAFVGKPYIWKYLRMIQVAG